ncbi:MAG TPA: hypothetical protein VNE86_08140 [Nitrososphaerales archaeon]|nr:hypothetical protein [Nitrososphaerales archaeon]
MANAGVIGAIAIVAIIAASYGSYYVTATPLQSSISSLQTNVSEYQSSISSLQTNVSEYQSVIASMSAHPSTTTIFTTLTQTTTSISTITTTSVLTHTTTSTSVSTSTEILYPIPENVTVYLIDGGGGITNYAISAGSISDSGSISSQETFLVSPVYQNESITVSISLTSVYGSCLSGQIANLFLYINNSVVSQSSASCGPNVNAQISYVL